jgi:hypothetical protein
MSERQPVKRRVRRKVPQVQALLPRLWKALDTADDLLVSPDPALRLKAAVTVGQLVGTCGKIYEIADLAERVAALEGARADDAPRP